MPILGVSGYSTAGKTFVAQALPEMQFGQMVSVTTRPIRPGEFRGLDYNYLSDEEFDSLISNNELLEWDLYCGYRYGLKKSSITDTLSRNLVPCHVCTPKGIEALKAYADDIGERFIAVFIEADAATITHRMIKRWQMMPNLCLDYLSERIATSLCVEPKWSGEYNFTTENSDLLIQSTQKLVDTVNGKIELPPALTRSPAQTLSTFDHTKSCILTFLNNTKRPRNTEGSRIVTSDLLIRLFHSA